MISINALTNENRLFLAPLAGITDSCFRVICHELGCGLTFTEMVSAKGLFYSDKKTKDLLFVDSREGKVGVQLFGHEEDVMRVAVEKINDLNRFSLIDLNIGCPAKKVIKNGDGSALMRDPEAARRVIRAVVTTSNVPVSVKFRLGWQENEKNYLQIGRICEEEGVSLVTLHPRTTVQMYRGKASREDLFRLKDHLSIPVVGNGDVMTVKDLEELKTMNAISIARGALHNPFLFRYAKGESTKCTREELVELMKRHYLLKIERYPEKSALIQMRKHVQWYIKGYRHANAIKNKINQLMDRALIFEALEEFGAYDD